jgi:DNA-binding NarL/FixJ family response regulator
MSEIPIALVDDHAMFRKGMAALLQGRAGIDIVLEAGSGEEFFELLPFRKPEIVLLDLGLPGMAGEEVLRRIRKEIPELKVLILSMHQAESMVLHLMEMGANGYLLKESEPEEVELAILSVRDTGYYFNDRVSTIMLHKLIRPQSKAPEPSGGERLTEREMEILRLICLEHTNSEIADRLFISHRTVEGHRKKIQEKLGARNTAGMIVEAISRGWVDPQNL